MLDLSKLTTESRNPDTIALDEMTPLEIARTMNQEDEKVVKAVKEVLPEIATAIQWATESLEAGGRIIYLGAGTSGRWACWMRWNARLPSAWIPPGWWG